MKLLLLTTLNLLKIVFLGTLAFAAVSFLIGLLIYLISPLSFTDSLINGAISVCFVGFILSNLTGLVRP